uniref:Uncharacterized protein n=1 Tax=Arundo donax TaxID=35708 RepID=A0A0A9ASR8_ARUDO
MSMILILSQPLMLKVNRLVHET